MKKSVLKYVFEEKPLLTSIQVMVYPALVPLVQSIALT
jgi:hypothetical protein